MSDSSLRVNNDTKRRPHSNTISGGRPPALDINISRPLPTRRNSEGSPHLPPICVSEPTPIEPSTDSEIFKDKKLPTLLNSRPSTPDNSSMTPPPPDRSPKPSATAPAGSLLDSPKQKKKSRSRGSSITSNLINEIKESSTIQNLASKIKSRQSEDAETEGTSVDGSSSLNGIDLASVKRNQDFHALFRSVPEDDPLIEDFGCALQKEILLQGRIYISENHLCFNANIFGWVTNLVIAFADITDIEKKTTAYFIPNAIQVSTDTGKHFFASFLSRDQAHDLIVDIWRNARPDLAKTDSPPVTEEQSESSDNETDSYYDSDTEDSYSDSSSNHSEIANKALPNSVERARQTSLASLPAVKDNKTTIGNRRRAVSELPKSNINSDTKNDTSQNTNTTTESPAESNGKVEKATEKPQVNETSKCECTDHYSTTVMDQVYNGSVEGLFNLLFNNDFMKKFLVENQKLTELTMGEWKKSDGDKVESREISYIKPLNAAIGPKSAKCLITEDVLHKDFDTFVTILTTTSTPDVPSGNAFTCKTKTCLTWAGKGKVKILVTVMVDFTKSSWFKGPIEKGSIDGQQAYYKDLDLALRAYLREFEDKSNRDTKKRRKGKRSKRPRSMVKPEQKPLPEEKDSIHRLLGAISNFIADGITGFIDIIRSPTSSHLTLLCLFLMVFINIFIARKMAYVEQQLINLRQPEDMLEHIIPEKNHYREYNRQEEQDLWDWLGTVDPDKSSQVKEKITFPSELKETNYDEAIHASVMAKERLDKHMIELSNMIQKAESNLDQVTHAVKEQRQKIKEE